MSTMGSKTVTTRSLPLCTYLNEPKKSLKPNVVQSRIRRAVLHLRRSATVVVIIGLSTLDGYNMLFFVAVGTAKPAVVSSSSYSIVILLPSDCPYSANIGRDASGSTKGVRKIK